MNSIPSPQAQAIMKKGKPSAAEYVHKDCCSNHPQRLNEILDYLLNPTNNINDWDTVDWCRWLVASGHTPDEFTDIGTVSVVSCLLLEVMVVEGRAYISTAEA